MTTKIGPKPPPALPKQAEATPTIDERLSPAWTSTETSCSPIDVPQTWPGASVDIETTDLDRHQLSTRAGHLWEATETNTQTEGLDFTAPPSALTKRFGFAAAIPPSKHPESMSRTERAVASLSLQSIDEELQKRTNTNIKVGRFRLDTVHEAHDLRTTNQAAGLVRDVTAALFSGALYELIDAMKSIDIARWAELPRHQHTTTETRQESQKTRRGDQVVVVEHSRIETTEGGHLNQYHNASLAGFYGTEISHAMVDLNNVLLTMTEPIAKQLNGDLVKTWMSPSRPTQPRYVFQREPDQLLKEGFATITTAIDYLLRLEVHAEPPRSIDQILDAIGDSEILNHMASLATVGFVERLVHAPSTRDEVEVGATIDSNGKMHLPQSFHQKLKDKLTEKNGVPGAPNETLKGCPFANKAIVWDESGKPQLTENTPLNDLTKEYLRLLREVMRVRAARAPAAT